MTIHTLLIRKVTCALVSSSLIYEPGRHARENIVLPQLNCVLHKNSILKRASRAWLVWKSNITFKSYLKVLPVYLRATSYACIINQPAIMRRWTACYFLLVQSYYRQIMFQSIRWLPSFCLISPEDTCSKFGYIFIWKRETWGSVVTKQ